MNFSNLFMIFQPKLISFLQYPVADDIVITPNFFITIISGVILALAFQFILTAISVATGVTAIGNLKESFVKSRVQGSDQNKNEFEHDQDHSSGMSTGVKISTGFGIWSVITTCIALFGATALALNINVVETSTTNITTALVIWGLFFLILFYVETRIVGSLLGNLISAVTTGLKSSANAISSMFTASPDKKIENVLEHTIDKVRNEIDSGLDSNKISKVLNNFMGKVDKKLPDYSEIKSDLEKIAEKSTSDSSSGSWMAMQQMVTKAIDENSESEDQDKQSKAKKLKETLETINKKFNEGSSKKEGVKKAVEELTSMDKEEIDKRTAQIEKYLSSSSSADLSSDKLKETFQKVLNNPKMIGSLLSGQSEGLSKEKIVEMLDSNTNLERDQIQTYADQASSMIQKVTQEFDSSNDERMTKQLEGKVAQFFSDTGRSELDYSLLKSDVQKMLDNPKDSLSVIKNRAATFDADTLRAVITNNKHIDESQIDNVLKTFSDSKSEVLNKVKTIETKAHEQVKLLERKAVIQAEHARATAASAAWWLVLTAILSAVAAIGGGLVTIS